MFFPWCYYIFGQCLCFLALKLTLLHSLVALSSDENYILGSSMDGSVSYTWPFFSVGASLQLTCKCAQNLLGSIYFETVIVCYSTPQCGNSMLSIVLFGWPSPLNCCNVLELKVHTAHFLCKKNFLQMFVHLNNVIHILKWHMIEYTTLGMYTYFVMSSVLS
jgi:hypothetical protein